MRVGLKFSAQNTSDIIYIMSLNQIISIEDFFVRQKPQHVHNQEGPPKVDNRIEITNTTYPFYIEIPNQSIFFTI